ncbi:MAG: SDR family oxidoreductase [Ignavibacteriae bacterium]|nr:SDR family oxidoreductase [Ignavibacteriota bacterium]
MNLGLSGKIALIAGASDGLGRAVAESLAAEGARLILCARRAEVLADLVAALRATHGTDAEYIVADLDTPEGVAHTTAAALSMWGRVDVLVTNNGGPAPGSFEEHDDESWERAWNRTLMSAVRLIRGVLPSMRAQRFGRIINITSISVRQPVARLLLSNAYRAAVTGMAKTLADEVAAEGITVNNIAPGYVDTARLAHLLEDRAARNGSTPEQERAALYAVTPMRRLGRPSEVGATAAFLASDQAAYITGSTLLVDGGLYRGV